MSESKSQSSDRRDFLSHMAAAAVVLAGTACAAPMAAAGQSLSAGGPFTGKAPFDDAWTRRVTSAKHRAVFDSPDVLDGQVFFHATSYMSGYHEMFGTGTDEVVPVIVMRHRGTVLAFNDALWEKYALGERAKVTDPITGKPALRNPFIQGDADEKKALVSPAESLEGLKARGAILLACNKAAMGFASEMAKKLKRDEEEVRAEVRNGIVPGVLLQPSGIYAVLRAQDVGCAFIKST